jgi:excisionase family DNA binding protein
MKFKKPSKMTNTILIQISPNELKDLVKDAVSDYFNDNPSKSGTVDHNLMTIAEAASFLNVSIPTLYAKTSQKRIPFHKKGKRLYFSKNDLIAWVKNLS